MNEIKYLTGSELARQAGCSYAKVLAAIHSADLDAVKIGGSYAVQEQNALTWIEQQRLLADPNIVTKLQAEIADLKAQLRARGGA